MAEYIDKEFVIDTIEELKSKALPKALLFDHLKKVIEIFPTEDFAPVKHGEWEEIRDAYRQLEGWMCKKCGRETKAKENYCPNCGAKMDGCESEEESNDNAGSKSVP